MAAHPQPVEDLRPPGADGLAGTPLPALEDILHSHGTTLERLAELHQRIANGLRTREEEAARLARELEDEKGARAGLQSQLDRLQALHDRQVADLTALQDAQVQWAADREDLLARLRDGEVTLAGARREHEERLAARIAERDAAQSLVRRHEEELKTTGSALESTRRALAQLEQQQEAWRQERKQLVTELGGLEQKTLELVASLKQEREAHVALKDSQAQLERDLQAFERREAQRHDQLAELQKMLEATQRERDAQKAESDGRLREADRALQAAEGKLEAKRREQEQWTEAQARLLAEMMAKDESAAEREKGLLAEKKKLAIDLERLQAQLSEVAATHQQRLRSKETEWNELELAFKREKEGLRGQLDELKKLLEEERRRLQQNVSDSTREWEGERARLKTQVQKLEASLAEKEARLKDGSKVEELNRDFEAKFRVLYDQSHDLNSPLNAIVGFSEVLLDEKEIRVSAEERREFLQHIHDSGKELFQRIRELINFAKEEAGIVDKPGTAEPAPAVPPPPNTTKSPVILVADNDPTVKERIHPFLSHAGYELVYATTAQEALRVAAQLQPLAVLIETQLPPKGGSALLYDLKREARTRDIPVVLTSRVNKDQLGFDIGNCDFLVKPIDRQQLLQMMVKFDLLADSQRSKVPRKLLLVDDDPQNIKLIKAMLRPFPFTILSARGGKEGIKVALAEKPDLIILDLMMPEVDGFEVVQALKKSKETARIPILIYTAKNITAEDRARLQGNIESIIQKGDCGRERFVDLINNLHAAQAG